MTVRDRLSDNFVAGILLVAPLVVTVLVFSLLIQWTAFIIDPIVTETRLATYTANIELLARLIAAGFVAVVVTMLGYLSRHSIGLGLTRRIERIPTFVPFLGSLYVSTRQVASAIGETDTRFKRLVMLEYPRDGIYSLGLMTGRAPAPLQSADGPVRYSIYLPNSPNPTGGRTVVVPEDRFEEVDMSIQEGLKLMLTTGISYKEDAPVHLEKIDAPED